MQIIIELVALTPNNIRAVWENQHTYLTCGSRPCYSGVFVEGHLSAQSAKLPGPDM